MRHPPYSGRTGRRHHGPSGPPFERGLRGRSMSAAWVAVRAGVGWFAKDCAWGASPGSIDRCSVWTPYQSAGRWKRARGAGGARGRGDRGQGSSMSTRKLASHRRTAGRAGPWRASIVVILSFLCWRPLRGATRRVRSQAIRTNLRAGLAVCCLNGGATGHCPLLWALFRVAGGARRGAPGGREARCWARGSRVAGPRSALRPGENVGIYRPLVRRRRAKRPRVAGCSWHIRRGRFMGITGSSCGRGPCGGACARGSAGGAGAWASGDGQGCDEGLRARLVAWVGKRVGKEKPRGVAPVRYGSGSPGPFGVESPESLKAIQVA